MLKNLNREISIPFIIGIIAVVVVAVGGIILSYQLTKQGQLNIQRQTTEKIQTPTSEDLTTSSENELIPEKISQKLSECSDMQCIKKIAIETKNIELCKKLGDQAEDCQDEIAIALNDPSKCSSSENCVMKIAVNKKDITICEKKYDKAWCAVMFPKFLENPSYIENPECYVPPHKIYYEYKYKGEPKYDYSYPNAYDNGENDYPINIAPESDFRHIISIPFNNSNAILRVYKDVIPGGTRFIRLVKYLPSEKKSELIGDIKSKTGSNWGGIYIPFAISKNNTHILFKPLMGSPGAGGGIATIGYAYLSLESSKYDECGYLDPIKIANSAYFYDNFSKALFYSEEKNVPPSEKPGPDYNSSIKFINIITGEIKTLLEEPNTIYEIINIDEESGVVNFKSCQWEKYKFNCPDSDKSVKIRYINLP